MFRFWRTKDTDAEGETLHYEGSFPAEVYAAKIGEKLAKVVQEKLSDAWIKEYGASLLEKISPEEVEKAIKQAIAEKVLK